MVIGAMVASGIIYGTAFTYQRRITMEDDGMKEVVDTISVATGVGALAGLLPAVAALFTIVWTGIRIWETETVKRMRGL